MLATAARETESLGLVVSSSICQTFQLKDRVRPKAERGKARQDPGRGLRKGGGWEGRGLAGGTRQLA